MKKVLVLNELRGGPIPSCCNTLRGNDYKEMLAKKKYYEKDFNESLNKVSSKGFELNDGKVYTHDVYVGMDVELSGQHGVYAFTDTGKKVQYVSYMGPVIEVEPVRQGCKFNLPGCKSTGCNFKGIACRSKGGNIQYVNFTDNQHNIDDVKKLNKYYGLRKLYIPELHDNIYDESEKPLLKIEEDVLLSAYKDKVQAALRSDITELRKKGLGLEMIVEVPDERFSTALIYSAESKVNVNTDLLMNVKTVEDRTVRINKFDIWYFQKVKGILRIIFEFILQIITLGFWKPNDKIDYTSYIEDQNLKQLEEVYSKQLTEQENVDLSENIAYNDFIKKYHLGQVPVTLAIHDTSWGILTPLVELFRGKRHNFYTCTVEMFKEKE